MNRYVTPHLSDFIFPAAGFPAATTNEIPGPAERDDGSKPRLEGRPEEPSAHGSADLNPPANPRAGGPSPSYQDRVAAWMAQCFSPDVATDVTERSHRFLEEALETVQACGCSATEAHQLVDYVFSRPVGELRQEVGGVLVCLAALCTAHQLDMDAAGEAELARVHTMIERIRAKHAAKPRFSPLPGTVL